MASWKHIKYPILSLSAVVLAFIVTGRQATLPARAATVNAHQGQVADTTGQFTLPANVQVFAGTTTALGGGAESLQSPIYNPPAHFAFSTFPRHGGTYVDIANIACAGFMPKIDKQTSSAIQVSITCTTAPNAGMFSLGTEGNMVPIGGHGKGGAPQHFFWQAKATSLHIVVYNGTVKVTPYDGKPHDFLVKNVVFITPTPQMPPLTARLSPKAGLAGKVTWSMKILFLRPNRHDKSTVSAAGNPLAAPKIWNITRDFKGNFYGGKAVVTAVYHGKILPKFTFFIRGTNATEAKIKQYILKHTKKPTRVLKKGGAVRVLWYATAIGQWESGIQKGKRFLQFNLLGKLGPNPDTNGQEIQATPNRSHGTQGWGIYQLTLLNSGLPSINDLWNWQQNVLDAIKLMLQKRAAVPGIIIHHYNHTHINGAAALAALCNAPIRMDGMIFRCGTAHIPIDILGIEAYNSLSLTGRNWPIVYNKITHRWKRNPPAAQYVRNVLNAYKHPR